MNGLELHDVHFSYATTAVLRGVDLEVVAGSFTSILGSSGSGKTTLLRVIAGFERPARGQVVIKGRTVAGDDVFVAPQSRGVGFVSQEGSLFPHLTVLANVTFGLERRERRGDAGRRLLEMVGLAGFERRYPHELSGGQQQRVALARTLAVRPELVVMDEPFSSLDAGLRHEVRREVRDVLRQARATAVLVTHDQDEALSMSDSVAVIVAGRIAQHDSPARLYAHPGSPELARGLGESNLVPGVAHGGLVDCVFGRLAIDGAGIEDGTSVVVLVRAEQLVVSDENPALTAVVVEREYYGHDAVLHLRADSAVDTELTLRTAGVGELPEPGARIGLQCRGPVVTWAAPGAEPPAPISRSSSR